MSSERCVMPARPFEARTSKAIGWLWWPLDPSGSSAAVLFGISRRFRKPSTRLFELHSHFEYQFLFPGPADDLNTQGNVLAGHAKWNHRRWESQQVERCGGHHGFEQSDGFPVAGPTPLAVMKSRHATGASDNGWNAFHLAQQGGAHGVAVGQIVEHIGCGGRRFLEGLGNEFGSSPKIGR